LVTEIYSFILKNFKKTKKKQIMKKTLFLILMSLSMTMMFTSCANVETGHTGVKITYGGATDMSTTYDEGMYFGLSWLYSSLKDYETREKTLTIKGEFLDADGLTIPVEAVLYYQVDKTMVNKLHKEIGENYEERKILPAFKTVLKNVIPKYRALELNTTKRSEGDKHLAEFLEKELPTFYINFKGVNIVDINIPSQISSVIIEKQAQDERNILAEKKKLEKENLAQAQIAESKGNYEAAQFDAKTKDILSQPRMLELYRAETDRIRAEKGVSEFGENNVFGVLPSLLRNH
jgi:regulator of protease activity HflC (stomatin/prohibitin superfamily)